MISDCACTHEFACLGHLMEEVAASIAGEEEEEAPPCETCGGAKEIEHCATFASDECRCTSHQFVTCPDC